MNVRTRIEGLERVPLHGVQLVQCSWCHQSVAPGEWLFIHEGEPRRRWCSVTCAQEVQHRRRASHVSKARYFEHAR